MTTETEAWPDAMFGGVALAGVAGAGAMSWTTRTP